MNFIFTLLLISVCEVQSLKCYLCVWTSLGNIVNPGWKDAYNDNCREADKEMKIKNCFKYATGCIALSSKLSDGAGKRFMESI
jgi:hypothetical protein